VVRDHPTFSAQWFSVYFVPPATSSFLPPGCFGFAASWAMSGDLNLHAFVESNLQDYLCGNVKSKGCLRRFQRFESPGLHLIFCSDQTVGIVGARSTLVSSL
jgi:hypothetical protein